METNSSRITGPGRIFRSLLALAGLLCFFLAAPKAARADEGDPPSRAARISVLDGTVSLQPGGAGDWGAAARNRPVTVGDKLWSDKDSRVELQIGAATIHVGSMTALSFLNLDENVMQVRVAEGAMNFRVRELREGDTYEVDTPNLAFVVKEAGAFRVEVSENGDATRITAIRGQGEVTAGNQTYAVNSGDSAEFTGTDNPLYSVTAAPPPDGLDQWAAQRDLDEDNSTSAKYVSRDTPGYSDLDNNGVWNEEPDYGEVWYPNDVPYDWAPYSNGYWNWVGPWGWTWIGYEPWGYAPYHYGRWAFIGRRWGWCPGPIFARPFFGPAFVGFVGGHGFGFGVGWFPLGFHEPFFPGFRASRGFINNINVRNTVIRNTTILNSRTFHYSYAHNVNAVTATSRNAFVGGQMINRGSVHLTEASLRDAEISNRASFQPTRQSAFAAGHFGGRVATPTAAVQNRVVMARTSPGMAATHTPVRTFNANNLSPARTFSSGRRQFTQSRPPANNAALGNRGASPTRTWEAQGSATDRGRGPQGFGRVPPSNNGAARFARTDRPPWAGSTANNGGRPAYSNNTRSYQPAERGYNAPSRTYNAPRSNYPASRAYTPPSRSYSAPSHVYSAPSSHSYSAPRSSGGGGGYHGGGGGVSHGGGGGGGSHGHH